MKMPFGLQAPKMERATARNSAEVERRPAGESAGIAAPEVKEKARRVKAAKEKRLTGARPVFEGS